VKARDETLFLLAVGAATAIIFGPVLWRPVGTCVAGSAKARYAAQVPAALENRFLDAGSMRLGFGAVAMGDWLSLGDGVAVNGMAYLRSTHPDSPNYYRVVHNRYFQSNYFVYLPPGREPAETRRVSAVDMGHVLAQAVDDYREGVIIAGNVRFAELRNIAISRAAVDGAPILQNPAAYYTRPMEIGRDRWAYVIALVLRPDAPAAAELLAPGTKAPGIAYVLRLDIAPETPAAMPDAPEVVGVGQVVTGSIVAEGLLEYYPLGKTGSCD
jgi:hypothetical protein